MSILCYQIYVHFSTFSLFLSLYIWIDVEIKKESIKYYLQSLFFFLIQEKILSISTKINFKNFETNFLPFVPTSTVSLLTYSEYFECFLYKKVQSGFSDYCLRLYRYIQNVSADMSSGLLQVFLVELGSLHGTSNHVLYLIHGGRFLWFH